MESGFGVKLSTPARMELVFTDLPPIARGFRNLYVGLGTPSDWARKFAISSARERLDGRVALVTGAGRGIAARDRERGQRGRLSARHRGQFVGHDPGDESGAPDG